MILSKYRPLIETFYSRKLTAQPQNKQATEQYKTNNKKKKIT